jgi:hypothetical protein
MKLSLFIFTIYFSRKYPTRLALTWRDRRRIECMYDEERRMDVAQNQLNIYQTGFLKPYL